MKNLEIIGRFICELFENNALYMAIIMFGSFVSGIVSIIYFFVYIFKGIVYFISKDKENLDMKVNAVSVAAAGFICLFSIVFILFGRIAIPTNIIETTVTTTTDNTTKQGGDTGSSGEPINEDDDNNDLGIVWGGIFDAFEHMLDIIGSDGSNDTNATTTDPTTTTTTETNTESTTQEDTTTTEKESSTTTETTTEPVKPEDVEHYFDDTAKRKLDKKSAIEDLGGKKCEKKQFEGVLGELGESNKHTLTFDSDSLVWLELTVENPIEKDKVGLVATLQKNEGVAFLSFSTELNGENSISDKVFVPKGDYIVSVAQGANYSGEKYNIILYSEDVTFCENEKNERTSTATAIEFKSDNEIATVYGVLSSESDLDFYGFEMAEDGHVSIKFEHAATTDGEATWDIELWDEKSTRMYEFKTEPSKSDCVSADIGLNKGKYYIRVAGADNCSSDIYAVSVCQKYGDDWEFEPNDTDSSAKLIYDDKYYYGNITESDSEDYYKFVCKKSGSYSIKFMQYDATINKTEENWGIKVMNERKDSILKNTLCLNYDVSGVEDGFELYKGETYYIRVSGNNYKKGTDYCFIIKKVD